MARPKKVSPLPSKRPKRKKSSARLIMGLVAGGVVLLLLVMGVGGESPWSFHRNKTIPQSEWQTFSPTNSGYTVLMPGVPTQQPSDILGISAKTYQVERKKEDAYFAVTIFDIAPPFLRPSLLEDVANSARDGVKARMDAIEPGSKVTSGSAISLGNLPGREYQITPPPTKRGTNITRLYLAKIGNTHRIPFEWAPATVLKESQVVRTFLWLAFCTFLTIFTSYFSGERPCLEKQTHDILDILYHDIFSDAERKKI